METKQFGKALGHSQETKKPDCQSRKEITWFLGSAPLCTQCRSNSWIYLADL